MGNFKNKQNSWLRYRKEVFCGAFSNMYRWFRWENEVPFFCFSKFTLFSEKFANLLFEGPTFESFSRFLNSISNISMPKDHLKVPKVTKSVKIILSPKTGSYDRFKKLPKSVTKVWKVWFLCFFNFSAFLARVCEFNFWGINF